MQKRRFANTSINLAPLGLGCMGMSWAYLESQRDDQESVQVIHAALDAGVDLLDTADIYGDGHNERLVGAALKGRRDDAFVATKCGLVVDDLSTKMMHRDGSPAHVRSAAEASLARLGIDVIDLFYLHRVDSAVPLAETWGAMSDLVKDGLVRHIGLSEVSVDEAKIAQAVHPVAAIQSELSLWTRDALESDVVGWCAAHGASFVPFAPLGRGFLTGAISSAEFEADDIRAANPRFTAEAMAQNLRIVEIVRGVADRYEATPAQVAIAWTLAQGEHVLSIPGTRRLKHLHDNIAAAELQLSADDLELLNAVPAAVGSRY